MNHNFNCSCSFSGIMALGVNRKYQEIVKLDELLSIAKIPHVKNRFFDGWKIEYVPDGEPVSDVVEHMASYCSDDDRMELMGIGFLAGESKNTGDIISWLTAFEVFLLWSAHYRQNNKLGYSVTAYAAAWEDLISGKMPNDLTAPSKRLFSFLKLLYILESGRNSIDNDFFDHLGGMALIEILILAVLSDDAELVRRLTQYQTRKRLVGYFLDDLICYAIRAKRYDIQVMLTNYKYENHLFREKKFDL